MAAEEPPQARRTFLQIVRVRQPCLDLGQRCNRLLRDECQETILVLFESLRPMIPSTRERSTTARFRPTDGVANAHFENPGSTRAGDASPNGSDHALTRVQRIGGWHKVLLDADLPGETSALRADLRKVRHAPQVGADRKRLLRGPSPDNRIIRLATSGRKYSSICPVSVVVLAISWTMIR